MRWRVWLADGTVRDSATCRWEDVPDGVLVLRWWGPNGKGINWGDGIYGWPGSHKQAAMVSDAEFARVLAEAHGDSNPPA